MRAGYLYLALAILAEVAASSALKAAGEQGRVWPWLGVALAYGVSFFFLSLVLRSIPLGIAYALWSGVGMVLIATIGWVVYRQSLDAAALLGLGLILAGVLVVNLFSKTVGH